MKMRAAVLYQIKTPLVVEEIEIDEPKKGEVLVKVTATGVCHSDLHFIEGLWPWPTPVVLGHEAAGIVERVGEGVASVQPGDHVVLSFAASCGVCRYCGAHRLFTNALRYGVNWGTAKAGRRGAAAKKEAIRSRQ